MMCNAEIYRQRTGREASVGKTSAVILSYVNLLLMMYVGAGLTISAQVYLDPTSSLLEVVLSGVAERLHTAPLLGAASLLTLLLGLLLATGLASAQPRPVLYTYSVCMSLLVLGEAGAAAWQGWQAYSYFADNPDKMKQEFSAKAYVAGALLGLCVVLQTLASVLAALAPPAASQAKCGAQAKQTNTLLLSCMGPTSNMPRCLRPLSGADYMPSSYQVRESDSSRRSMRSKGWQLQPQVGWQHG